MPRVHVLGGCSSKETRLRIEGLGAEEMKAVDLRL